MKSYNDSFWANYFREHTEASVIEEPFGGSLSAEQVKALYEYACTYGHSRFASHASINGLSAGNIASEYNKMISAAKQTAS